MELRRKTSATTPEINVLVSPDISSRAVAFFQLVLVSKGGIRRLRIQNNQMNKEKKMPFTNCYPAVPNQRDEAACMTAFYLLNLFLNIEEFHAWEVQLKKGHRIQKNAKAMTK
ncbi:hypothetical protein AB6A40_002902 [Gnathostoma spinigerum]|uniref:Uncharacterized protein n=1 Tax=Gnathostoma spinigerum TaxID=75299 RepID=A0ABD6E7Y3_9BILA